ncbi:hypothetical protein [Shinella sp. BYT-45]|uniref:hypothetical protein n=1 Tax=Shinella sp. BYT-45 TaxID=3377377 RepID=UPI00397FA547
MRRLYHVGTCPLCNQGRLFLQKNLNASVIYAHCEECEHGYRSPGDIGFPDRGFLTLTEDYDTDDPTREEISRSEWARATIWSETVPDENP